MCSLRVVFWYTAQGHAQILCHYYTCTHTQTHTGSAQRKLVCLQHQYIHRTDTHTPNPCYWGNIRRRPPVQPVYNKTACLQYLFLIFFKLLTWITTFSSIYFDSFFFLLRATRWHGKLSVADATIAIRFFFRARHTWFLFNPAPPIWCSVFLCSIIYVILNGLDIHRVCAAVYVRLPNGLVSKW